MGGEKDEVERDGGMDDFFSLTFLVRLEDAMRLPASFSLLSSPTFLLFTDED